MSAADLTRSTAADLARQIASAYGHAGALVLVAGRQAEAGATAEAQALASEIGAIEYLTRARIAIARAHARRGEVAARFAREGYAVVVQDCRGRFDSEGQFTKYLGEAHDGADTLQWIMEQPWCNGRVGTYGLSYAAHTQTALATQRPRGLKAMFLECGGFANAYRGGIRHGGAFELKQAVWALRNARAGSNHLDPAARRAVWQSWADDLAAAVAHRAAAL